jgi:hypothetical protein
MKLIGGIFFLNLIVEDLLDMRKLGWWISFEETFYKTSYAK